MTLPEILFPRCKKSHPSLHSSAMDLQVSMYKLAVQKCAFYKPPTVSGNDNIIKKLERSTQSFSVEASSRTSIV